MMLFQGTLLSLDCNLFMWVMQVADLIILLPLRHVISTWVISRSSAIIRPPRKKGEKVQIADLGKGTVRVRVHAMRESRAQRGSKTQPWRGPCFPLSKSPAGHLDLCNIISESVGCLTIFLSKLKIFLLLSIQMGQIDFDGTIFSGSAGFTETHSVASESLWSFIHACPSKQFYVVICWIGFSVRG